MRLFLIPGVILFIFCACMAAQPVQNNPYISEFLPNPIGDLETEWIEVHNPSARIISLQSYLIGDANGYRVISDTALFVYAFEYIVMAQDRDRFLEYYPDFMGRVFEPVSWPILNNDGDIVKLGLGLATIDSVIYDEGFPDNRSWERFIDADGVSHWGASFDTTGASPGRPNTYFVPRLETIDIGISPNPFSPNGDGRQDMTCISYNPPEADDFDLKIYDISGRLVKTIFEDSPAYPGEVCWDGRDDDGMKLPVGIYIVYAAIEGGASAATKTTVVIAR